MPQVKRISSGVPGFDKMAEGGFKEGSINLLCGGAGSGKTTFAIQFLLEGMKRGEPGVYVTFEERKQKLYDDMLEFGWDLAKFENEGLFRFIEYTPQQIKKVLVEGGGTLDAVITQLRAKRLVIDSITSFSLLFKDELSKKESALALFDLINSWKCTALLTSQATSVSTDEVYGQMEFEVDSIIIFYHYKVGGIRKRAVEILKMRGTKTPENIVHLEIGKKGVEIFTEKIVSPP